VKPGFHSEARKEFRAAVEWYESRVPKLGAQFAFAIRKSIARVCENPAVGKPVAGACRQVPLERFPFSLVYRMLNGEVRIIAIAHYRRLPGYWNQRR
jgi:toxin ParE1/3/4